MDSPLSHLWPFLRAPVRILLCGAAALLVLGGARIAGLLPLSDLLPSGSPAQSAALLVFLVGVSFAAFLWWLAARSFAFLRDPRTTPEQLNSLRELPLALPEGTVRALLALIVGIIGLPLLLFSQALALTDATAGYVNGIVAGVFGYYFGARSTAGDATATRRLGEVLAGQGRHADALREENAALRDRAERAAAEAAAARPGQLAAALDALGRQIAIAANLLEVLGPALPPGLIPAGAPDALARARAVAAEAGALVAGDGADAVAVARVTEATAALAGRDGAFAALLRAAAAALPASVVGGGPLAGAALLLGLGWRAGSAAWRRWRAQVLAAPHDPALFDACAIAPSSPALRLEGAPLFAAAFADLRDRPGFAADLLDIALRDDAPARLWAEHGGRFASPEAAAAGLAEFRRALLAESAAADLSAPLVQAVAAGLSDADPALRPESATPEAARALLLAAGVGGSGAAEARAALQAVAMLVGLLREQKVDALRGLAELTP